MSAFLVVPRQAGTKPGHGARTQGCGVVCSGNRQEAQGFHVGVGPAGHGGDLVFSLDVVGVGAQGVCHKVRLRRGAAFGDLAIDELLQVVWDLNSAQGVSSGGQDTSVDATVHLEFGRRWLDASRQANRRTGIRGGG